jgi:hypothetical protein
MVWPCQSPTGGVAEVADRLRPGILSEGFCLQGVSFAVRGAVVLAILSVPGAVRRKGFRAVAAVDRLPL